MLNPPKRSVYAKHRVLFIWAGIVVEVVLLAVLAVLAIFVFGVIYFRVTEDPKFCGYLCHNMSASYESYKKSSHNGILCAECHSEPGVKGFIEGTLVAAGREVYVYTSGEDAYDMDELHPKIHDKSCLRHECHKIERLAEQRIMFAEDNIFSHRAHLSATSHAGTSPALNCISCHSQSKEKHMATDRQVCFLCHFGSSEMLSAQKCSSCHAIPAPKHESVAGDSDSCAHCHEAVAAEITASSEKCTKCHETMIAEALDSESAHEIHVKPQNARCMECHEPMKLGHAKVVAHYKDSCQKCHSAQESMYQGSVKFVAEKMPSPKAEAVECSMCHVSVTEKGLESLDRIKQACAECHEASYAGTLDNWQETIREEIKEVEQLLSDVDNLLKASEDKPQKKEVSSLYKEARERLLFVQMDGSSGAHNVDLADKLLTDAKKKLTKCQELLK